MSDIQTTTFKGARYVPKFEGVWDSTNEYEAIVCVQHNAFSYLSKQPVPAGVEITNTEFWMLWADPNAQMMQLTQDVDSYRRETAQVADDLTDLDERLTDALDSFQVEGTEMVVFGDSWSASSVSDSVWAARAAAGLGLNLHNYAINGAHTLNNTLMSQANSFNNDIANGVFDKDKIKYVVFLYGVNDQWTYPITADAEIAALENFLTAIYPNIPESVPVHHFINFTWGFAENTPSMQWLYWLGRVCPGVAGYFGNQRYTYTPLWPYFNAADMNTENYFHLTLVAQARILCPLIISQLTGGTHPKRPSFRYVRNIGDNNAQVDISMNWDVDCIESNIQIRPNNINTTRTSGVLESETAMPFELPYITDNPYTNATAQHSALRTYGTVPPEAQVGNLIKGIAYTIGVRGLEEDTRVNINFKRNFGENS